MTRAQDVRAVTNGWRSSVVRYGSYTGRGKFKIRGEEFVDQYGNKKWVTEATLAYDPTQLPIEKDNDVVITQLVDGVETDVTWTVRHARPKADGLLMLAILAKA